MTKMQLLSSVIWLTLVAQACHQAPRHPAKFTGAEGEVKLITLAPGHFHAALVQKSMYPPVASTVHVFAPAGPEVTEHLNRIERYNAGAEAPTQWLEKVYTGTDYLEKMLTDRPGNVVVLAGNNRNKTDYISAAIQAGLNVFADKPMCIGPSGFAQLQQAFAVAEQNGLLLYDIMTERFEITSILQKYLTSDPELFGTLQVGSLEAPAVVKESVHHFFKYVSGQPLQRPAWYFDTDQQGEGLVDITTHLVDLVQWACFPEQILDYRQDVEMVQASHWPTVITPVQFEKVTQVKAFPDFLAAKLTPAGDLPVFANGEMIYKLKGIHIRVRVSWNFEAPAGGGDSHFSLMRGTKAEISIRQGAQEKYRPELYVRSIDPAQPDRIRPALERALAKLASTYPGLALQPMGDRWQVQIPDRYRSNHEAHFSQVMERYLAYLVAGKLPEWEVPNMLAKYYTTTQALKMARPVAP